MPKLGAGGAAKIHAARARKLREEVDRIEAALDRARIGEGESVADRVEVALAELVAARTKIEDLEWEQG